MKWNICTQITLLISSKTDPSTGTKAVLHCYHTDNKIQLQGGPLGSTGLSSASWIAKNLIIPLTHSHIEKNQENIRCINEEILATHQEPSCEKCKKAIAGDTLAAKDQALKGRVWEWNKLVLKHGRRSPDYAAIIYFPEKFLFMVRQQVRHLLIHSGSSCHLSQLALLQLLGRWAAEHSASPSPFCTVTTPLCQPFSTLQAVTHTSHHR